LSTPACSGGADRDDLVRVDALVRLLAAGQLLDQVGHGRHAGRATDEHHVVDVAHRDAGVLDDLFGTGPWCARAGRAVIFWNSSAGQLLVEVQRALRRVAVM
jgi:hypothetical protein